MERPALFVLGALRFRRIAPRQTLAFIVGRPNACSRFEAVFVATFVTAAFRVGANMPRKAWGKADPTRVRAILPVFPGVAALVVIDDILDPNRTSLALVQAIVDRESAAYFCALLINLAARRRRRRKKSLRRI